VLPWVLPRRNTYLLKALPGSIASIGGFHFTVILLAAPVCRTLASNINTSWIIDRMIKKNFCLNFTGLGQKSQAFKEYLSKYIN
jgi:hypothetical protein